MDIKIENGDIAVLPNGYPETVSGFDEVIQRIRIGLSFKKGSFAYDRNLGILRDGIDFSADNAASTVEACINEALINTGVYAAVSGLSVGESAVTARLVLSDGVRERTTEVILWTAT